MGIERAQAQRLYLLSADRHPDGIGAAFSVLGSTGNVYKVDFSLTPGCDCPDFLQRGGLCKHVLFIWLRVLRCSSDDPRIWQKALLSQELIDAVQPLFDRKSRRLPSLAGKAVRDAFAKATGSAGDVKSEEDAGDRRKRQTLEGEECAVCFEAMTEADEARHLLCFCGACGN